MISSLSAVRYGVAWKYVFLLTSLLMALHFFLINGDIDAREVGSMIATAYSLKETIEIANSPMRNTKIQTPTANLPPDQVMADLYTPGFTLPDQIPVTQPPEDQLVEIALSPKEEYFSLCVAAKDQAQDLPEFLSHHYHHMNVSRFYIMDDRSDPPLETFDYPEIPRSALTFNHYTEARGEWGQMQLWIYEECMFHYRANHTWMGFIDVDEFLEIRTNETMEGILREFPNNTGQLSVNWKMQTSSGLIHRPKSVRESFVTCIKNGPDIDDETLDDRHVKSIVRTEKYNGIQSPHMFRLKDDAISVGEDGKTFSPGHAWRIPITRERTVLHHYVLKSKDEFQEKADRWKGEIPKGWDFWDRLEKTPHMDCPEMARYVDADLTVSGA